MCGAIEGDVQINDLRIEYADNESRHAKIYANGLNQVPVLITIVLVNSKGAVENFDVKILKERLRLSLKRDGRSIKKGENIATDKELYMSYVSRSYNHAIYVNGEYSRPNFTPYVNKNGRYSILCYLASSDKNASYEFYASLELNGVERNTDKYKCLTLETLPAINWSDAGLWNLKEGAAGYGKDLSAYNSRQPLDSVTHKVVEGPIQKGDIILSGREYHFKYNGVHHLPPFKIRGGKIPAKTKYYDISDNSFFCALSACVTPQAEDELSLWCVSYGGNAPEIKGKMLFMIGCSQNGHHSNIFMETITIPDVIKPLSSHEDSITLFRTKLIHDKTAFFAVNDNMSPVDNSIMIDIIDDFGNHGTIEIKIRNLFEPLITFHS